MDKFAIWIVEELNKKDWTSATLSKRSGINSGSLSHILNGTRKAGADSCLAIARALNLPPEQVFRKAGLLPSKSETTEQAEEALHLFQQLSSEKQRLALKTLRAWLKE